MSADNPNLLIIMADEHQAGAMGCADHPVVKTPNLDSISTRWNPFYKCIHPFTYMCAR